MAPIFGQLRRSGSLAASNFNRGKPLLIPAVGPFSDQDLIDANTVPSITYSGLGATVAQSLRPTPLTYNIVTVNMSSAVGRARPAFTPAYCIFMRVNELRLTQGVLSTDGLDSFFSIKNTSNGQAGASGSGASGNNGAASGANGGDGGIGANGGNSGGSFGGTGSAGAYAQAFFTFGDGGDGGDAADSSGFLGGVGGIGGPAFGGGGAGAGNEGSASAFPSTAGGSGAGLNCVVGRLLSLSGSGIKVGARGGTAADADNRGGGGGGGVIHYEFLAKVGAFNPFSVTGGAGFANGGDGSVRLFMINADSTRTEIFDFTSEWDNRAAWDALQ